MSTAMYDAREALIPGSVYDRSSNGEQINTFTFMSSLLLISSITEDMCCIYFGSSLLKD